MKTISTASPRGHSLTQRKVLMAVIQLTVEVVPYSDGLSEIESSREACAYCAGVVGVSIGGHGSKGTSINGTRSSAVTTGGFACQHCLF